MSRVPYSLTAIRSDDDSSGKNIVPYASVSVVDANGNPAQIYLQETGGSPSSSFALNENGFKQIWAEPGRYTITIDGGETYDIFLAGEPSDRVRSVATIEDLRALQDRSAGDRAELIVNGIRSMYEWVGSDLSRKVSSYLSQNMYVPPLEQDGSSGAWVRTLSESVSTSVTSDPDIVDVLIVYGQSNARGYANSTPGIPEFNSPLARVWNGINFAPNTSYTPTASDGTSTGSAWLSFANEYCGSTSRNLVILNCAKGSQSISELQKGGANYSAMTGWVAGALSAIALEGSEVGHVMLAFSQGERDSQLKTSPQDYYAGLSALWDDIADDFSATAMGIFTTGYYANSDLLHGQVIQQVQRKFARNTDDAFIAYDHLGAFGMHNKLKSDIVHYNQRGYNIMGREGARRFIAHVFRDAAAPASDQTIRHYGSLLFNQSQAWNYHGAVLRKAADGSWSVGHASPGASSFAVSAVESDGGLLVKLSNPATTVLSFAAQPCGALAASGLSVAVGDTVTTASGIATVDPDGYSYVKLFFYADIYLRINMIDETLDIASMRAPMSGVISSISADFPETGRCDVYHPMVRGLAMATILGANGRFIRSNSMDTSTIMELRDAADARVDGIISVMLPNMLISPADLPSFTDVSMSVIAADYGVW